MDSAPTAAHTPDMPIYEMPPDRSGRSRWRVFVEAGPDAVTGTRRKKTKVVPGTKKDAEIVHARLLVEYGDGRLAGTDDVTLAELLERFVTHKTLSTSGTTADTYRHQLAYITPRLAAMPIGKVRAADLDAFYAHLAARGNKRSGKGLSAAAIRNVHVVIRGAFELARRYGWVAVNPAANAEPPKLPHRLPSPAPAGAIDALFRAAADEHPALPTYLRVTLCVGGRRAEVHGLRWSTVDFGAGRVTLRETVVRAGKEWVVNPTTKTGGERFVDIDTGTLELLRVLHDQAFALALSCGAALPADAFVFTDDPVGAEPWKPATTARRFKRACVAAGLPATTRLHDLRHLMATHLIDEGLSIATVSARLGHAQNSTTLDIYTGRVAGSDRRAADAMGRLLDGGQSSKS
jgi:integrase